MKHHHIFLISLAASLAGIWLYSRLSKAKPKVIKDSAGNVVAIGPAVSDTVYQDANGQAVYVGPNIDPKTGAYMAPGTGPGTVQFSAQGN